MGVWVGGSGRGSPYSNGWPWRGLEDTIVVIASVAFLLAIVAFVLAMSPPPLPLRLAAAAAAAAATHCNDYYNYYSS